ncbi:MAG: hypothetical protein ACOC1L_07495 [Bacillota bacterium]
MITALSVPLIYNFGPWPLFIAASVLSLGWMAVGLLYFGKLNPSTQDQLKENHKEKEGGK